MLQINFLLPDSTNKFCNIQDQDQVFYRNISKDLNLEWPEEFIALCELNGNKVLSKFYHKLDPQKQYKLFHIQQLIGTIEGNQQQIKKLQENEQEINKVNEKLKETIQNIQGLLDAKLQEMEQVKSESDIKCKEVEKKWKQVQTDQNQKAKDFLEEIQSLKYELQKNNSASDKCKQEMEKKLKEQEYLNKRMQEDIQINQRLLMQEQQKIKQVTEEYRLLQQQSYQTYQRWKQYQYEQEFKLNQSEKEKQQLQEDLEKSKRKNEKFQKDLGEKYKEHQQLSKENQQLSQEKSQLEYDVQKLKRKIQYSEDGFKLEIQTIQRQYEVQLNTTKEIEKKLYNQKKKNSQLKSDLQRQTLFNSQNVCQGQTVQNYATQRQFFQNFSEEDTQLQKNENLKQLNSELQANLNKLKSENINLNNQLNTLRENLNQIQDESNYHLSSKEKQIQQQKQQIENLLFEKDMEIKDKFDNQNEVRQRLIAKEKDQAKEIERLNNELKQIIQEKEKIENDANAQRQNLLKQINESDRKMLEKDQELAALQNSAIVPIYQYRIQRLVEQAPREYFSDIECAIETMMIQKVNSQKFLKDHQAQCKKMDFILYQVKLNKRADSTLYNVSDQDYRQIADDINIGNIIGIKCQTPVNSTDQSLDQYFYFQCLQCPARKEWEGKILGIRQSKTQDPEELETKQTAIDNCLATLISQDFMNKFVKELSDKRAENILKFKFREQYIIESKQDFKKYLLEITQNKQIQYEGIHNFIDFINSMSDDQSNEFYEYIKEYQYTIKQQDENIIQAYLKNQNDDRLEKIYKKYNPAVIKDQLNHFINYIGGIMKDMPLRIFYTIQEIEIKPDFKKYNGGRSHFEKVDGRTTQSGKFFSAFSYYSIIRSQRQLCISYLQGVQNQLYDPLVSTNDGFLDKFDQGYHEIRTIESKFQSEANIDKGIEYMKALGIRWN